MVSNLQELFRNDLKYLYDAEKRLSGILPEVSGVAESPDLRELIGECLKDHEENVNRIESISDDLGVDIKGEDRISKGMEGLSGELSDLVNKSNGLEGPVLDAALIGTLQRVQHYEIASYGTLGTYAAMLGNGDASSAFGQIVERKRRTDEMLTDVAVSFVNVEAKS